MKGTCVTDRERKVKPCLRQEKNATLIDLLNLCTYILQTNGPVFLQEFIFAICGESSGSKWNTLSLAFTVAWFLNENTILQQKISYPPFFRHCILFYVKRSIFFVCIVLNLPFLLQCSKCTDIYLWWAPVRNLWFYIFHPYLQEHCERPDLGGESITVAEEWKTYLLA